MPVEHSFTWQGAVVRFSDDQVREALQGVPPGRIAKHSVEINGVEYPVNQAFSVVTGTTLVECNTLVSRKLFKRLGFTVKP